MNTEDTSGQIMASFRRHASIYAFAFIVSLVSFLLSFRIRPPGLWGYIINPFGFLLLTLTFGMLSGFCRYTYKRMVAQVLQWIHQWEEETKYLGSVNEMRQHPLYKKIVSMGEVLIPILLKELRDRQSFVFVPLAEIVGESLLLLLPQHCGGRKISEIRNDWLLWGKKNGYL